MLIKFLYCKLNFSHLSGPGDQNNARKSVAKQFGYNKFENEQNGDVKLSSTCLKSKSKLKKEVTEGILIDLNNSISVSSSLPVFPSPVPAQTSSPIQYSPSLVDLSLTDFKQLCCIDRERSPEYDTASTYSASSATVQDRYYNVPPSVTEQFESNDRYYSVPPENQTNYYSPVAEISGSNYFLSPLNPSSSNLTRMGSCPALPTLPAIGVTSSNQTFSKNSQASKNGDAFKDLLENFDELGLNTQAFPSKCQTATISDRSQMLEELKKTLGKREMHSNFSKNDDKQPNVKIPLLQPPQAHTKRKNRSTEQPHFPSDVSTATTRLNNPPPIPSLPPNTAEVKPFVINNPVTPKSNLLPNNNVFNFYRASVAVPSMNSDAFRKNLAVIQNQVSGVTMDECQVAYHKNNGNMEAAVRELQLMQLCRLGIAPKHQCEKALESVNWNLELAASSLVDAMQNGH